VAAAMKISIQSLLEGARNASGAVAVIDTFRAFTTAAVALVNGASRIIMVGTVEEALALRAAERGAICMGEVRGHFPPPVAISQAYSADIPSDASTGDDDAR
jgi:2-phosphosulfolactate phosphatase